MENLAHHGFTVVYQILFLFYSHLEFLSCGLAGVDKKERVAIVFEGNTNGIESNQ